MSHTGKRKAGAAQTRSVAPEWSLWPGDPVEGQSLVTAAGALLPSVLSLHTSEKDWVSSIVALLWRAFRPTAKMARDRIRLCMGTNYQQV